MTINIEDRIVSHVREIKENSIYYNNLYRNIEIDDMSDFYKLPMIDSSIFEVDPQRLFTTNSLEGSYAFSTGGSSGEPKYIYLSKNEFHSNISSHGDSYRKAGINKHDRVAVFGLPGLLNSEFSCYLGLEKTGCFILPIGEYDDYSKIYTLLNDFKINALLVMPTDLVSFVNYCKDNECKLEIEKIITGGESFNREVRLYVQNLLNVKQFGSTYQSMDFGSIGYQDKSLDYNQFIINNSNQYIEIMDENNENVFGEHGEIIVTNLSRKLIPIVRYRTGDIGKIEKRNDGLSILTLKGRKIMIPKIGGEKFYPESITEYLSESKVLTSRYQYVISKKNNLDHLLVKVESIEGLSDEVREEVEEKIKSILLDATPKLRKQVERHVISSIDIEIDNEKNIGFIKVGSYGKFKTIIDMRKD